MPRSKTIPQIPLPKAWSTQVKSAVVHVIALAQYALIYSRSWAADGSNQRVRLRAECDRLEQEVSWLREEIRLKDLRMTQIEPPRRPHYPPTARMAILELRTARCWSLEQTAKTFLLTAETISSWVRRKDETGVGALVQIAHDRLGIQHAALCQKVRGHDVVERTPAAIHADRDAGLQQPPRERLSELSRQVP